MSNDNQSPNNRSNCPSKQRDCYDKINVAVAVIGLFVVIAYTTFAGVQSYQMYQAR
jgi:hypothetical protein